MPLDLKTFRHLSPSKSQSPLTTGLHTLDKLLHGGIPLAGLTEIYGPPASAKTALHLSTAAHVVASGQSVVIVDTEGCACSIRIAQLVSALLPNATRADLSKALARVTVIRVTSVQMLFVLPHVLADLLARTPNVRLLCVDSVAALYRTCDMNAAPKRLEAFAQRMHALAVRYDMAVVLVNHAKMQQGVVVSAMGESWTHVCSTRIALRRMATCFALELIKSPVSASASINFQVECDSLQHVDT